MTEKITHSEPPWDSNTHTAHEIKPAMRFIDPLKPTEAEIEAVMGRINELQAQMDWISEECRERWEFSGKNVLTEAEVRALDLSSKFGGSLSTDGVSRVTGWSANKVDQLKETGRKKLHARGKFL